jgi:hypothetical protein
LGRPGKTAFNQGIDQSISKGSKIPGAHTIHKPLNSKNKIECAPMVSARAGRGAHLIPEPRAL